jgi:ribose 5-phosphate isomerase RpiB
MYQTGIGIIIHHTIMPGILCAEKKETTKDT